MILKKLEQYCKKWLSYWENSSFYLKSVDISSSKSNPIFHLEATLEIYHQWSGGLQGCDTDQLMGSLGAPDSGGSSGFTLIEHTLY